MAKVERVTFKDRCRKTYKIFIRVIKYLILSGLNSKRLELRARFSALSTLSAHCPTD